MLEFMPFFWLCLIVLAFILEAATMQLASIWFAFGGIISLIVSLFVSNVWVQIFTFILSTIISLILTRPAVRKLMNFKKEETNVDRYIGKVGVVILEINNEIGTGQVNIGGSIWTSRSFNDKIIPVGRNVKVESIQGVKLIVKDLQC